MARRAILAALALASGLLLLLPLVAGALWVAADPAALGVAPLPLSLAQAPGAATLSPGVQAVGTPLIGGRSWRIDVTLAEALPEGGRVDVIFPAQVVELGGEAQVYCSQMFYWTLFQTFSPEVRGYISIDPVPGVPDLKVETYSPLEVAWLGINLFKGRDRGVLHEQIFTVKESLCHASRAWVRAPEGGIPAGATLTLRYGAPGGFGWDAPKAAVRAHAAVLIAGPDGGAAGVVLPPPELVFTGGEVASLGVLAPTTAAPGASIRVQVRALDGGGIVNEAYEGAARVTGLVGGPARVTLRAGKGEVWGVPEGAGVVRLRAEGVAEEIAGESNPLWVGEGAAPMFWGDVHRHSVLADGWARPEEVWRRAREVEGLDFAALSEHSHPDPLNFAGLYLRRVLLSPSEWRYLFALTDAQEDPGTFATLQAYEWSGATGHRNVYVSPGESLEPLLTFYPDADLTLPPTPSALLGAFSGRDAVVIPHHTAFRVILGERIDWGEPALAAEVQTLVEIYSEHGSSEAPGVPRPLHGNPLPAPHWIAALFLGENLLGPQDAAEPGLGNYVEEALAAQLPMGIMAAGDVHFGPGAPISFPGGLMVTYGAELDRRGIYDAMKGRRVGGTTGARMAVDISFREARPFGQGVIAARAEGLPIEEDVVFEIKVMGATPLSRIQLRRHQTGQGYDLALDADPRAMTPIEGGRPGWDGALRGRLKGMAAGDFVYLRVLAQGGETAWLGPFWAGGPEATTPALKAYPGPPGAELSWSTE